MSVLRFPSTIVGTALSRTSFRSLRLLIPAPRSVLLLPPRQSHPAWGGGGHSNLLPRETMINISL